MSARGLLAGALACGALLATAPSAGAIPPRTCGRIAVHGTFIVRVHVLPCRTGMRWARDYAAHRAVPRGYTCERYRGPLEGIPWVCRNNRVRYRQFWVVKPSA